MMAQAESFDDETWESFDGKDLTLPFMGHDICTAISNLNDEGQHRLNSRIKTVAVGYNKVSRSP